VVAWYACEAIQSETNMSIGKGALFDYTNPNGLKWWHSQLQQVLDQGIDGWKCDGTDPFIYGKLLFVTSTVTHELQS